MAIDYVLRVNSTEYYALGMGEEMWFISHSLLGLITLFVLYLTFRPLKKSDKVKGILLACILGVVWYFLVIYTYILGSGIDSF